MAAYTQGRVMAKRNLVRWAAGLALLAGTAGCGGISATKSISPLDFFLPGLIQNQPAPVPPSGTNTNAPAHLARLGH
ncbi:MAG TPA: hypothetical protein PKN95_05520 [Verrucomicrobiota bacterium]|nr:hypothetical protein [Verrucomicrobiota bacterium]HNT13547.1 hypothetical protein [Verrucomicrobiota bacterium]